MTEPPPRKGALRMADIPPDVLGELNAGRLETVTLVEWLAIDQAELARNVGLPADVVAEAERVAGEGVTRRLRAIGTAIHSAGVDTDALARHPSDMVRAWAAFALAADESLDLTERLQRLRRFAADRSMATRECAWDSFRPYVARELDRGLELLRAWVVDDDPPIRRAAVEGTRPRGVWTQHIEELKREPERGLPLLEPVRSDPSDYVRRAVANWLNDASKSRPDWVVATCERWLGESPTAETRWIVNHAQRTLRKRAAERAE